MENHASQESTILRLAPESHGPPRDPKRIRSTERGGGCTHPPHTSRSVELAKQNGVHPCLRRNSRRAKNYPSTSRTEGPYTRASEK